MVIPKVFFLGLSAQHRIRLQAGYTMDLFDKRVQHIVEHYPASQIRDEYSLRLYREEDDTAQTLSDLTPPDVASLFNEEKAPSVEDFAALPWQNPKEAGVYAHVFLPQQPGEPGHVYVGSSSRSLRLRRTSHEYNHTRADA